MAFNFQSSKIATFSGINASPIAPTATSPGNASHLIRKLNDLVDSLESQLGAFDAQIAQDLADLARDQAAQASTISDLQEELAALGPPPTLPLALQSLNMADFATQIESYEPIEIDVGGGDLNFVTLNNNYTGSGQNIYLELINKSVGKQIFFACIKNGDAYLNLSFFNNGFALSDDWLSMNYGDVLFVHGIFVPGANNRPHLIKLQSLIYVYQPS